jgi:hypothetical protein
VDRISCNDDRQERDSTDRNKALAMTDLKSPTLIYLKGWLFLTGGIVAAGLLVAEAPRLKVGLLLGTCLVRLHFTLASRHSGIYGRSLGLVGGEKEELAEINSRLAGEKVGLELENAKLKKELEKAQERIDELQRTVARQAAPFPRREA